MPVKMLKMIAFSSEQIYKNPVEKCCGGRLVGGRWYISHSACVDLAECDGNIVCIRADNKG